MEQCRLSVNTSGAFYHPLGDVTTIDCRYGELLSTVDLPDKLLLLVDRKTPIPFGRVKCPRAIVITNVSNHGIQQQPTAEELAEMEQKILYVGFNAAETYHNYASLELPPMVPGKQEFGGSQFLWLRPGADVWLDVPEGVSVTARIQIFPGADNG